ALVRQEAAAACRALDQLAESNQRLRACLKELQEGKSDALAQKYSELHRSFGSDERRLKLLDEVAEELEAAFKALMLLPETGILQELIDRLEEAAQPDDGQAPGEQELLGLLRAVHSEIKRIDKSRPEAWKSVLDMIQDRRSDLPSHSIRELDPAHHQPIRCARCCSGLERHDLLFLFAQALNGQRHHVAGLQPRRRLHAERHPRRRARGDDIAGFEHHELRDVVHAVLDDENHGLGVAGLAAL